MKYQLLFEVLVRHDYYPDQRCTDFVFEAPFETLSVMRGYHLVMKPRADGFQIYVLQDDSGELSVPITSDLTLRFSMQLKNPSFPYFTHPDDLPLGSGRYYVNEKMNSPEVGLLLEPVSCGNAIRDFAAVDIRISSLAPLTSEHPGKYEIKFRAPAARWEYFVVADGVGDASGINEFDIRQSETSLTPDSATISFEQVSDAIPKTESQQNILSMLSRQYPVGQYPKIQHIHFASKRLIDCRQKAIKNIHFYFAEHKLLENIQNPSINYFGNHWPNGMEEPAASLFQVIKFIPQPLLNGRT